MNPPARSPFALLRRSLSLGCVLLPILGMVVPARGQAGDPPRTAWVDLRPPAAGAVPQNVPAWVETVEFLPAIPGESKLPLQTATLRLRIGRPAGVEPDDDLLLRLFFREGPGGADRPRVTAWDELGHRLLDSGPLGEGLPGALGTSEAITVPMAGVNYLEIASPDESAVRGVHLLWLQRREAREPADFPAATVGEPERAREMHLVAAGRETGDRAIYGTLTASLQPGTVSLTGAGANTQQPGGLLLDFELERPPLAALLTFEILTDAPVDAPPEVFVNGRSLGAADFQLPDLDDPGYQGETAAVPAVSAPAPGALSFHYTGWLRARKILPASALQAGVNRLLFQLSNDTATGAVRAVDLQLKYSWEKLDYIISPALNPPPSPR